MSTMTEATHRASPAPDHETASAPLIRRPLELSGRAVLLATDGSPSAVAAAHVASALAAQHQAIVHVVNVVDTRPAPLPPPLDVALAMGDATDGTEAQRERDVRAELSGALGGPVDWPVRVMVGTPSAAIVQEADHLGAALIVMGLRRHGRLDRAVRDETALEVMRVAGCPVLGVVAEWNGLPRRVLAAVDFSDGSLAALRAGHTVLGDGAVVVLAYVSPSSGFLVDEGEARIHDLGVQAGFDKLTRELDDEGVSFDRLVLHAAPRQTPAQALLEYADEIGSDLITAGSVQHSQLDRWMVGSVSAELVRNARRSVLIVPPRRRA